MNRELVTKSELIHQCTEEEYRRFIRVRTFGMEKVHKRMVREITWGILLSQSLRLTRIARWVNRTTKLSISVIKRMSRRLRGDLNQHELRRGHLHAVGKFIGEETSIVVDTSDLSKAHGKAFEHLDWVYDGSTGETVRGYNMLGVTAVLGKGRQMPLYLAPYSTTCDSYESVNTEVLRAIETVTETTNQKGLWIWDRGFDNQWLFNELAQRRLRFLICGYHHRSVVWQGKTMPIEEVVTQLPLPLFEHIGRRGSKKKTYDIHFAATPIMLPPYWDAKRRKHVELSLWVLVVKGYDPSGKRTFFFTNVPLETDDEQRKMVRRYADRWAIEEEFEFLKQRFALEDVRVRSFQAIERLMLLAMLAFAFLVHLVERFSVRHKRLIPVLCSTQSELDPDARFLYYRIQEALQLACSFIVALNLFKTNG